MPKVINYTPEWLSRPSPGYDMFIGKQTDTLVFDTHPLDGSISNIKRNTKPGPRRVIARRGTEVFVAVGKEIRWADLVHVKQSWESHQNNNFSWTVTSEKENCDGCQFYRTIKTSVADDIRQLLISPLGNFMAILTTHTVHIAIIPELSQLNLPGISPIKLISYTLGPTTHVTSQAGIVSALWHPLGVNGTCIVTVTEDAVVRVWELSIGSHGSFDQPTLEIDLKKLADGTSSDQDFRASSSRTCKTFSPDSFEMEVASACFAGKDSGGWSPMTLWIAMRCGDIYALCPLLPEKWSPTANLISSLSVSIVAKIAAIEDDSLVPQTEKDLAQQQLAWISDIDNQEPLIIESKIESSHVEVFTRPPIPGKIPRLQGPFDIELAPEESVDESDGLFSDIYVIGGLVNSQELGYDDYGDFYSQEVYQEGLSIDIICLISSSGRLSVCLNLDGVEAQWLPKSKKKAWKIFESTESPSLLTFEVIDVLRSVENWEGSWPLFSDSIDSRYSFFITATSCINFIDLSPWVSRLGAELDNASAGSDFRIDILAKSRESTRLRLYTKDPMNTKSSLSACVSIRDHKLGYFLLTASPHGPIGLTFESPGLALESHRCLSRSPSFELELDRPPTLYESRPVYEPAHTLRESSRLPAFLDRIKHSKFKRLLKEEIRLSPAMLSIMTEAHKVLSEETHRIGTGAAELFRRCEGLQVDLITHIRKANEVATRIDSITGIDHHDTLKKSRQETVEERLKIALLRQKDLTSRIERLSNKVIKGTSLPLSEREKSWAEEVQTLETKLLGREKLNETTVVREPWARYEEVCDLSQQLFEKSTNFPRIHQPTSAQLRIPFDIKKQKMEMVQTAIERETALVDAVKERLDRLIMTS